MRHATAEYCENAEARIRALEEELEACAQQMAQAEADRRAWHHEALEQMDMKLDAEEKLARLQPVVDAARAYVNNYQKAQWNVLVAAVRALNAPPSEA